MEDQIIAEKFEISNYLIELAKKKKKFNFSVIKKKLSISDNQLESIENGKIDFMPFPFNYHITKQYVKFVDTQEAYKIKEEFFLTSEEQTIHLMKTKFQIIIYFYKFICEIVNN